MLITVSLHLYIPAQLYPAEPGAGGYYTCRLFRSFLPEIFLENHVQRNAVDTDSAIRWCLGEIRIEQTIVYLLVSISQL